MRKGVEFALIDENKSEKIDKLFELYRKSPHQARVVYFSDKEGYTKSKLVLFEDFVTGDFTVAVYDVKVGISTSNRIYKSEKKVRSIVYKKGLFWYSANEHKSRHVSQLTYSILSQFFSPWSRESRYDLNWKLVKVFKKFGWLRFIDENPCLQGIALNTFIRNKLYSRNDAFRFLFKAPLPTVLALLEASVGNWESHNIIRAWKEIRKVLTNIENLKAEFLRSPYFMDSCRIAMTNGEKINCSWSHNRLKNEHDKWAKQITNILFDTTPLIELTIGKPFLDFGERYGYRLLRTNKELYYEGRVQNHCVGTYVDSVNRGDSGIFHHMGYTLELIWRRNGTTIEIDEMPHYVKRYGLNFAQMKGYKNSDAPDEMVIEILKQLDEYNASLPISEQKLEKELLNCDIEKAECDYARPAGRGYIGGDGHTREIGITPTTRIDWLQMDLFVDYTTMRFDAQEEAWPERNMEIQEAEVIEDTTMDWPFG